MERVLGTDPAAIITTRIGSAFVSATAGGAGDNTSVNGTSIDRQAIGLPLAAVLTLYFAATLASNQTLSITALKVQDSADGSTWADYKTLSAPGAVLSATGSGQSRASVGLSTARRYVRVVFTPDLSASGTDTANVVAGWALTGFNELPSPA